MPPCCALKPYLELVADKHRSPVEQILQWTSPKIIFWIQEVIVGYVKTKWLLIANFGDRPFGAIHRFVVASLMVVPTTSVQYVN